MSETWNGRASLIPTHLTKLVDAAAIVLWGTIAVYFIHRYVQYRKLVSLMLAFMSAGWGLIALIGVVQFSYPWPSYLAVVLGSSVWYAIIRVERTGR